MVKRPNGMERGAWRCHTHGVTVRGVAKGRGPEGWVGRRLRWVLWGGRGSDILKPNPTPGGSQIVSRSRVYG